MKMTIGQKATRVLRFLLGLRSPHVAKALRAYGFDEGELSRGWALLQGLTHGRLDAAVPDEPTFVRSVDAWENKWYPIVQAALASNFPAVHDSVFRNLAQTSGAEVIVSVGVLLDRIDLIAKPVGEGGMGREGKRARDLLTKRGLTVGVVNEARASIAEASTLAAVDEDLTIEDTSAQDRDAELRLWAWYLEWSQIARSVITERRQLRALGFLRRNEAGEDIEMPDEPTDAPSPPA